MRIRDLNIGEAFTWGTGAEEYILLENNQAYGIRGYNVTDISNHLTMVNDIRLVTLESIENKYGDTPTFHMFKSVYSRYNYALEYETVEVKIV